MASISIFTFDHDPPRVSSPWSTPPPGSQSKQRIPQDSASNPVAEAGIDPSTISTVECSNITKLEAEPQDGPTEYKLHLLLRRRRSFVRTSTGKNISGSLRRVESPAPPTGRTVSESGLPPTVVPPSIQANQSRQHRLEQLTTQLFWRLQQSCPHHISSSTPLVVPQFPNEAQLSTPVTPQRLLPGLEESRGALYEIGVADDGTFVGLAEDEMEESLNNLRAMAASLGCRVDVLRKVQVGECEWVAEQKAPGGSNSPPRTQTGKLWVVEALVYPDRHLVHDRGLEGDGIDTRHNDTTSVGNGSPLHLAGNDLQSTAQQLRVSLTGATMSGKSSLLGSLSTSTLDNGRGKSRLSLLKHRHEIASGMTSSVTQELIGYRDIVGQNGARDSTQVVSYGTGDVSDWAEIHASAEGGRLVFLSDSAGHPRFRRTTVRGLVGWDPHWTLLCIPADSTEDQLKSQEILGPAAPELDLSQAHLQLCLNLELPLVIVITKLDVATKQGLRQTCAKILSALKAAGRTHHFVNVASASEPVSEADLNTVSADDLNQVAPIVQKLTVSPLSGVPIILTSAVKGAGITKLHAFLRELPIPRNPEPVTDAPRVLFHIEDVYSNILAPARDPSLLNSNAERSVVIGGHVRYGTLRVGAELLLGPYAIDTVSDDSDSGSGTGRKRATSNPRRSTSSSKLSRSFPGALREGQSSLRPADQHTEWRRVRITSIRNLRLPVRTLHADQVGTIGIAPIDMPISSPAVVRIRKGMVLADGTPKANRSVMVRFAGNNAEAVKSLGVGSGVVVYVASVRASAKVVSVAVESEGLKDGVAGKGESKSEDDGFGFGFDDDEDEGEEASSVPPSTVVTFQFIASKEFYEMGAKVLVLPGGGPGLYGGTERGEKGVAALEGMVGYVTEGY